MIKQQINEAIETSCAMAVNAILSTQKDPMDIAKEEREYECENAEWQADAYMDAIEGGLWIM